MNLTIREGGHRDLDRMYPSMEMEFDSEELMSKLTMHKAMMNGSARLLILCDGESGITVAYAFVLTKNMYGYVLLKYFSVLPWYRRQGVGVESLRLIHREFAEKQGILTEITDFPDENADRQNQLRKFFARFGYVDVPVSMTVSGTAAHVLVKPIKGTWEIEKVAPRILRDFYSRVLTPPGMAKIRF